MSNVGVIEKLTAFEYKDTNQKDWGLNVRQRAKELVALVNDPDRIRSERQKVPVPEHCQGLSPLAASIALPLI